MLLRNRRLRRDYLYRKSLEGKERLLYEKKRKIKEALAALKTHIDDEYANATERDPKIIVTTSQNPTGIKVASYLQELKFVFPNAERINRGGQLSTKLKDLIMAFAASLVSTLSLQSLIEISRVLELLGVEVDAAFVENGVLLCKGPAVFIENKRKTVSLLEHQKNPKKPLQKRFQNSLIEEGEAMQYENQTLQKGYTKGSIYLYLLFPLSFSDVYSIESGSERYCNSGGYCVM
ncbi:hypothetical protein K2173_024885 [Erythroxylum novogranatense]|uniref:Brix domain-containing protein n=1 Tax=Erythroxylum novogranatense TaxID=1862640 RepID=A0AAV8UCR8_9ROSI|nr:hypothetical protein K2173_024885 [Erythroxylum novogranatense]